MNVLIFDLNNNTLTPLSIEEGGRAYLPSGAYVIPLDLTQKIASLSEKYGQLGKEEFEKAISEAFSLELRTDAPQPDIDGIITVE